MNRARGDGHVEVPTEVGWQLAVDEIAQLVAESVAVASHALERDLHHRLRHVEADGSRVRKSVQDESGDIPLSGPDVEDADGLLAVKRHERGHDLEALGALIGVAVAVG